VSERVGQNALSVIPAPALARATALILLSAACFGSIAILVTLATRSGAPLVSVLAWRYLLATLILFAAAGAAASGLSSRRALTIAVLGGAGQALIAFVSLSALRYVTAATLSFLFYTYPAWVTLFAVVRGKERVDGSRLAALGCSLAGVALMIGMPGAEGMHPAGVALALGSAVLYAAYIPMINSLTKDIAPAASAACIALGAGILFTAAGLATGTMTARMAPAAWAACLTLALVSTALAFIVFLRGLAVLGPVRTAIISAVEPFFTAVLGALFLAQALTAGTLGGGALIALAVYLLHRRPSERVTTA
jgi:drug/metabolite transporter (DMT)-like permease